jgi:hypothetical protein
MFTGVMETLLAMRSLGDASASINSAIHSFYGDT